MRTSHRFHRIHRTFCFGRTSHRLHRFSQNLLLRIFSARTSVSSVKSVGEYSQQELLCVPWILWENVCSKGMEAAWVWQGSHTLLRTKKGLKALYRPHTKWCNTELSTHKKRSLHSGAPITLSIQRLCFCPCPIASASLSRLSPRTPCPYSG